LDLVERDFSHDFRPDIDRVGIASDLELEEFLRLPRQHLVGQPLERLSQHDEAAALGIARAEVEVAERPFAAAAAPLGREDYEIERARLLHFEPGLSASAGGI